MAGRLTFTLGSVGIFVAMQVRLQLLRYWPGLTSWSAVVIFITIGSTIGTLLWMILLAKVTKRYIREHRAALIAAHPQDAEPLLWRQDAMG